MSKEQPTPPETGAANTASFLQGGGEMGARVRAYDWSSTPLGVPEQWQQSLKTAIRIMLTSRQPMWVWWGQELINLYNDAYIPILGGKHPSMLGKPASVVWHEIWDQVGPRAESVMFQNEATYDESLLLIMERNGYPEETYYTFSYSPIPDDQGGTGGILCANTDDTQRVIGERQLALLRELAAKTADARTFEDACRVSARCLESNLYDLPFAMIYLVDSEQQQACLSGISGIEWGHPLAPNTIALNQNSIWHFHQVMQSQQPVIVADFANDAIALPTGAWPQPPRQAVVLPIVASGETGKSGLLVVGLNPFRLLDDNYRGFLNLVTGQIAASIANAQAYEEERKRAEALAEIDRAKTVFFSNISHEFRTPLTLMLSPLEELLQTLEPRLEANERDQLQLIQRNGLRLQKLVNTLLDFSRIEAGRVQASYEPTDLAAYTAELASVFRSLVEQAGIALVIDCSPLPEPVYVDREMWEKIVLNLVSNAFKFTFKGHIAVRLKAVNQHVEFSVSDTGVGIPEVELPRLFERFHRVSGTKSRTYEGSGIGLALVQELVKLHGGTIAVASQLEQGTTFTIALPLGSAHLSSDRVVTDRNSLPTAPKASSYVVEASRWLPEVGSGRVDEWKGRRVDENPSTHLPAHPFSSFSARILLADDNADMRDYVKRLLGQFWTMETVSDGLEALDAIAHQPPDLVLSDVMMPRLDGFGLLRELRANTQTREIPIILLSARAGEESRIEGLEAGADDYLIKPFSARELIARVEATLKLAQMRRAAREREQVLQRETETVRENLESILSNLREGFLTFDRDWRYTYINDRQLEIIGRSREDLLGKSVWEVFPDIVDTEIGYQFRRAMKERIAVEFEVYYPPLECWFAHRVYPTNEGIAIFVVDVSERKRAEQQLRESEKFLKGVNEAAPNLLYIFDLNERRNIYVGPQIFPILGISSANVQALDSQLLLELFHPDDLEIVEQHHDRIRATQEDAIFTVEYRMKHTSGKWLWLSSRDTIFARDDQGRPTQILGSAIDITDRKHAEELLRKSEERYRALTELSPQFVFMSQPNGSITYCNQWGLKFTGRSLAEMQGDGWAECIHPDHRDRVYHTWITAIQTGSDYEIEIPFRRVDGVYRWLYTRALPVINEAGAVDYWIGVALDIDDRKQAEAELRQKNAILDVINESAPTPIFVKNRQGYIIYANPATLEVFGKSAAEVIGYRDCDIFPNLEDAARVVENDQRIMESGQTEVVEESPDGIRIFLGMKAPYRNEAGEVIGLIGISNDITDRVQIERDREQILQREQAAREAAEQANRIKDEFLAVLSHELRSPLNPILGWAKLLQTGKLDAAKTAQAITTIERNAKLQAELIEDLLDVSRILQGKLRLNVSTVSLATTIQAAIETVRLAAEAKSIAVAATLAPDVSNVSGDPTRLQQVVWNLLSNAVKFTPSGGRVEVKLEQVEGNRMGEWMSERVAETLPTYRPTDPPASYAQITVTDTGKGISPDFLPHVFEYFRQEDGKTTRKFGGLGLGLAIVRHLVELHGGTIVADSLGEGQGATFTVRLPLLLRTEKRGLGNEDLALNLQSPALSTPLAGLRILLVDDEPDSREFITFVLEEAGATITTATNASDAFAQLNHAQFDVLLSDIGMPEMDGYMLIKQVRALPPQQGGNILAIALTAYAGELNQQQALAAGFQEHIPKPVEPENLVTLIVTATRNR